MSGYDENLLKNAPEATRAERQEGYNLDLLAPERTTSPAGGAAATASTATPPPRTPSVPPAGAGPSFPPAAGEGDYHGVGGKEYSSVSQEEDLHHTKGAVPFWHTGRGKLLVALLVLVVIGAIVGGAVGGTVGHHKSHSDVATSPSSIGPVSSTGSIGSASNAPTSTGIHSQPVGPTSATGTATEGGASGGSDSTVTTTTSSTRQPSSVPGGGTSSTGGIGSAQPTNGGSPTSTPGALASLVVVPPHQVAGVANDRRRRGNSEAAYGKDA